MKPSQREQKQQWREQQKRAAEAKLQATQQQQDKAELYQQAVRTQLAATSALDAVDYNVMEKAMLAVLALFATVALVFAVLSYTGKGGATQAGHLLSGANGIEIEEDRIMLAEIPVGTVLGNPRTSVDTTRQPPSPVDPLLPGAIFVGGSRETPLSQIPLAGPNRVLSTLGGFEPGWALGFGGFVRSIPHYELSGQTSWMPALGAGSYLVSVQPNFLQKTEGSDFPLTQHFGLLCRIVLAASAAATIPARVSMEVYRALVNGMQVVDPAPPEAPDTFNVSAIAYTGTGLFVTRLDGSLTMDVSRTLLTMTLVSPLNPVPAGSVLVCVGSGDVAVEPIPV